MADILLADDQPHILRVLRLALAREGHQVTTTGNGQEALDQLRKRAYDVLITDVQMPVLSGIDLCETINRELPGRLRLTLIITAQTDRDLERRALSIPNTEFLEKPLSLRNLKARLESHFCNESERP